MTKKDNPELIELINKLKKHAIEEKAKIWKDIAVRLQKPLKNWAVVNVSKIERYANNNEIILVPGKILGAGRVTKKVIVAAYRISESAQKKITAAGGKIMSIEKLMIENPQGSNIKILR